MGDPIPPIPNEGISKILSYLEKNDLLKCRLMNHSLNELSLKILKNPKYGHQLELTRHNIEEFLEFSSERNEEWILPLHLNFNYTLFGHYRQVYPKLPQLPNYIQQLQRALGETCVGGFTLSHESASLVSVEVLLSILTLVAPSLTHLDLCRYKLKYLNEGEKLKVEEMMIAKTDLNFPNLSTLMSCPAPSLLDEHYNEEKQENEIHSFLIKRSQNLKELQVISPFDLSGIDEQIGSLRILRIVEHLDTFAFPNLPVLNDLSLTYSSSLLDHQILTEFLVSFSSSLQRLTIFFQEVPKNPFPRLGHLRFLCILVSHSTYTTNKIHLDPEKLNLNSEAFPALECMDISTNVYFESTDGNSGDSKDDWSLRTVKTLSIRVTDSPFIDREIDEQRMEVISRATAKDYVDQLQHLFPNVISLTLVNETNGHESYLNELLTVIIQSDGAPRIQELEILNCEENFLGHILNGLDTECQPLIIIKNMKLNEKCLNAIKQAFQDFSGIELSVDKQLEFKDGAESRVITCKGPTPTNINLKMTGLEKIKIHTVFSTECNEDSGQLGIERESNQKDLFLMSLPKHFPLLRQIYISQRMFGEDKDFCKQQIVNVQDKFPNLIINTTD